MRFSSLAAGLLLLLSSLGTVAADKIRVRVTEFAPLYFKQAGQWVGLDVELAQAIVKEAGYELDHVQLPWSRALLHLRSGEIDLMLNLTRTPDREVFTHFVGPVRMSKRALVVRRENLGTPIADLDGLVQASRQAGLRIGIQQDAKYTEAFDARLAGDPEFARHFDLVAQGAELPKKVARGRNLGFFEDVNYAVYHLRTDPDFAELAIHPFLLDVTPAYIGVSRQTAPDKLQRIETAFRKLEANGTLAAIRAKWADAGGR